MQRQSSSEAAWSVLTSNVSEARVEAHRLRHLVNRGLKTIEKSEEKDHIYQMAGDLIGSIPDRLDNLERLLDKTTYALALMGEDFFASRLPLSDKNEVNEAIQHSSHPFSKTVRASAARVADAYLRADLMPQLGKPGGPCQVVDRIERNVTSPKVREDIIDDVERGRDLSNTEASAVYSLGLEPGQGYWKTVALTSHSQYRMDLRGISVPRVLDAIKALSAQMRRDRRLEADATWNKPMHWVHKGLDLLIASDGPEQVRVVTVYPVGSPDPKAPGEGGCSL